MKPVYVNSADRKVSIDLPVSPIPGTVDVSVLDGDTVVHEVSTLTATNPGYEFSLPFKFVQSNKTYEVHWVFSYQEGADTIEYNERTSIEVVTPILPLAVIKEIIESDSDDEAVAIEMAVRYIIQAHTGQTFGKYVGVRSVTGSGKPFLRLPERLISYETINGNSHVKNNLNLRGSGWYLQAKTFGYPPTIKADNEGYNDSIWSGHSPIIAPNSKSTMNFTKNYEYAIDGVWGWASVPMAVQEAAKLLVNDYACGDSMYRDRFIQSVTAADWRLQFHDSAFIDTGNVRANQLLQDFVLHRGWIVV